jgi:hypothetical protein
MMSYQHDVFPPRCEACGIAVRPHRDDPCDCTRALARFPRGLRVRFALAPEPTHRATKRYRYGYVGPEARIFKSGPHVDIEWEGEVYEPGGGFYHVDFLEPATNGEE